MSGREAELASKKSIKQRTFQERQREKERLKVYKERVQAIKSEREAKEQAEKQQRERRKAYREQEEDRLAQVQVIRNAKKLKKMSKKQFAALKKVGAIPDPNWTPEPRS